MLKNKYELYEASVQEPIADFEFFDRMSKKYNHVPAHSLREDFCGTFRIATDWVKWRKENTALALDLDPKPLEYGKKHHWTRLTEEEQKRLEVRQANVMSVTSPKVDIIAALNFSYFTFKKRDELKTYFQSCYASLKKQGLFILDILGGLEMGEENITKTRMKKKGQKAFTYIWEQKNFNPITNEGLFYIHFKLANGKMKKRAFTYDWRVWNLIELQELANEAGFKEAHVYWEDEDEDGEGNGVYRKRTKVENCEAWVAYVVCVK